MQFRFSRSVLTDFDVDVVHVVEPQLDQLLGTKHAGALQTLLATLALIRNLRKHRIALVRTIPGIGQHPRQRPRASVATRLLDRATSAFVIFDVSTHTPDARRTTVIPHAHFRDRFLGYPRHEMVPGRVLCIAGDRLPAVASGLIAIPQLTDTPGVTLRFCGEGDEGLKQRIRAASARHSLILSGRLENLSDGGRVQEIEAAEIVAVPEVRTLMDLQTVFMALSLNRPVITPATPMMTELARQIGPAWLHLSEGPITAAAVDDAMGSSRRPGKPLAPDMAGRDLVTVRMAYQKLFARVAPRSRS